MNYLYKHGLPFSRPLDKNLIHMKERITGKKASMIIVDGGVGEGKTTMAVHIAEFFQGKGFNLDKQYAIGGEQFQEKLIICYDSNLSVIIYDEAGDFNSRNSLSRFNQMLNRVFETYRAFKILVILVLPSFHVLDNSIFDKKIPRMLIHCHNRTNKSGRFSVYSLYRMYYIKKKIQKYTVPTYAYSGTTSNYRGHFLDLPPEKSKHLEKISIEGKKTIITENILKNRNLISYNDIAKKFGKSIIWVRKKIAENKIKHQYTYKRKMYFSKEDLDALNVH